MVSGKSKPVNRRISSKITPAGLDPKVISGLPVLARSFYAQPAQDVAAALIGQILVHRPGRGRLLAGRIVEAEAYLGLADRAAHAYAGRTPRTKVLFGPPGHAYVYLIYGMYHCLATARRLPTATRAAAAGPGPAPGCPVRGRNKFRGHDRFPAAIPHA